MDQGLAAVPPNSNQSMMGWHVLLANQRWNVLADKDMKAFAAPCPAVRAYSDSCTIWMSRWVLPEPSIAWLLSLEEHAFYLCTYALRQLPSGHLGHSQLKTDSKLSHDSMFTNKTFRMSCNISKPPQRLPATPSSKLLTGMLCLGMCMRAKFGSSCLELLPWKVVPFALLSCFSVLVFFLFFVEFCPLHHST